MQRTCANLWCKASFDILAEDREFLKKFDVPEPTRCPDCRHQWRSMFRTTLVFYRRTSDLSGKPLLTVYSPTNRFPVYAVDEWWSDIWDALAYGKTYDFSLPFFLQFQKLHDWVPKMAAANENCENCEYCNGAGNARDSYYCSTVHRSQDVYYSERITGYCSDIVDCLRCQRSSHLYESVHCVNSHLSSFLFHCSETRDSHYCIDCNGCHDCLFSSNLRNTSFVIFNKPVEPEEYRRIKAETIDGKYSTLKRSLEKFGQVSGSTIWKNLSQVNCEECVGDLLTNCARCYQCFASFNAQDVRYAWDLTPSEKCISAMDLTQGGIGELLYNSQGLGGGNYFMRMCIRCRLCSNMTYCIDCYSCKDCFGCTGLRNKRYCILNVQYTKEEYEDLLPRVIAHLRSTREWGEFFPIVLTPCAYNQSAASRYFPLQRGEVLRRGWKWEDLPSLIPASERSLRALPDAIDDTQDDLCEQVLTCTESGRNFKILKKELEFYRTMRLPIPRVHPDIRMLRRWQSCNPYKLWTRPCMKCGKEMQTTYAPERPEIVYCEECYLKEVY
ncbi:TPA: hypothetical protein DCL30_05820 [Candidatus Peribacteria bacterium]|nr:MAG: hypothetical protein A3J91_01635 [Candidatus Peribacteria bacterium RIFOXYC2_FULL_58_10]OGJ84916.1 MAG: hypothetical protein A2529_00220 [Candidatus Peribacteria bacterium RIFOXYD2_FULL_58_15]HAI99012.1 hypothetical protein [Candidatus Peribacteria bacterium]HAS34817.1 hypothetical protein [Candidatus Peribacteria bacterium]